jgi:protein SCO1/2
VLKKFSPAGVSGFRAAVSLFAVLLLSSCDWFASSGLVRGDISGIALDPVMDKPEFVAPATDGSSYDLRKRTDGDVALVFFGYMNCPDICPVHMHNLGEVLRKLPEAQARRIHVVFVTTDPERDTIERLSEWLASINPRIIGVRPTVDEAIRVQSALGLQPAMLNAPKAGHEGRYDVGHATQVIVFTPDNRGRFAYPPGARQEDLARDLPRLLNFTK